MPRCCRREGERGNFERNRGLMIGSVGGPALKGMFEFACYDVLFFFLFWNAKLALFTYTRRQFAPLLLQQASIERGWKADDIWDSRRGYELLYRITNRGKTLSNSTLKLSLALCKLKARVIAKGCLFPCPVRIVTHQRANEMAMNVTFSEYIVEFKWSWTFACILLSIYRRRYKLQ